MPPPSLFPQHLTSSPGVHPESPTQASDLQSALRCFSMFLSCYFDTLFLKKWPKRRVSSQMTCINTVLQRAAWSFYVTALLLKRAQCFPSLKRAPASSLNVMNCHTCLTVLLPQHDRSLIRSAVPWVPEPSDISIKAQLIRHLGNLDAGRKVPCTPAPVGVVTVI